MLLTWGGFLPLYKLNKYTLYMYNRALYTYVQGGMYRVFNLKVDGILTLRLLISYIYIYIYIYIYMERIFLMFLDHTQRRSTVGMTPLDE